MYCILTVERDKWLRNVEPVSGREQSSTAVRYGSWSLRDAPSPNAVRAREGGAGCRCGAVVCGAAGQVLGKAVVVA